MFECRAFVTTMWMIWYERNRWVHEGKKRSGLDVASFVKLYLKEYKKQQNKFLPACVRQQSC